MEFTYNILLFYILNDLNITLSYYIIIHFVEATTLETNSTYTQIDIDLTYELQHLWYEERKGHCIVQGTCDNNNPMYYHEPMQTKI